MKYVTYEADGMKRVGVLDGDQVGSGTAATGSGLEIDRWLQPEDEIEMEADGVGTPAQHRRAATASLTTNGE